MYYLKLFDKNLLSFEMDNKLGLEITDIKVLEENRKIFPINLQEEINSENLISFIKSRIIPKNRAYVHQILESMNLSLNDTKGIIDISKGLSLTDSYWIVQDENLKFSDYNLFDNDFSEVLSLIAFTGYSSKIKDLITSPEFTTNGALPKAWRRIDGEVYLYKGSTESWNFSNTGFEPYSEYYSSQLLEAMGIDHVKYDLERWKNMLCTTCKLFTSKEKSYIQAGDIIKTGGINAVYEYVKNKGFENKFSDMILFDSLTSNVDRHFGNFGFIRNNATGEIEDFAPIFDNGEGLLSKATPDVFEDMEKFKQYINSDSTMISYYGTSYKNLVETFCNKSHIEILRKLLTFKFSKHPLYNVSDNRLKCLSFMLQERARMYIDIIKKNEKHN